MNRFCSRLCAAVASVAITCTAFLVVTMRSSSVQAEESTDRTDSSASKIDRGRYLVRTAGCNDCHTPGYAKTAGDVEESKWLIGDSRGFQGPWGTTYPANLRQLVQGMSEETWLQYARRPIRPPMPWFALRDMTDEDLAAILCIHSIARALDSASAEVRAARDAGDDGRREISGRGMTMRDRDRLVRSLTALHSSSSADGSCSLGCAIPRARAVR